MEKWMEYFIGGILCLIIAIVSYVVFNRLNGATIVAIVFFIYGVYRAIKHK